jgi:DNA polymerase-1
MVACDYDGQELRLLAAFAGDPQLTKEVLSGDLHGKLAGALWGPNYTDQQRSWTKNALYAFCYGGGAEQVAKTAHRPEGEAEKAMRVALPGMLRVYDRLHKVVLRRQEEDGVAWAKTLGGRQVAAPKSKLYVIGNYLQQGSGADILKMAMDRLCTAGLEDYITLPIHDEILFSLPPEIEGAEVAKIMETEFRGVPFSVHASKRGPSWGAVV